MSLHTNIICWTDHTEAHLGMPAQLCFPPMGRGQCYSLPQFWQTQSCTICAQPQVLQRIPISVKLRGKAVPYLAWTTKKGKKMYKDLANNKTILATELPLFLVRSQRQITSGAICLVVKSWGSRPNILSSIAGSASHWPNALGQLLYLTLPHSIIPRHSNLILPYSKLTPTVLHLTLSHSNLTVTFLHFTPTLLHPAPPYSNLTPPYFNLTLPHSSPLHLTLTLLYTLLHFAPTLPYLIPTLLYLTPPLFHLIPNSLQTYSTSLQPNSTLLHLNSNFTPPCSNLPPPQLQPYSVLIQPYSTLLQPYSTSLQTYEAYSNLTPSYSTSL